MKRSLEANESIHPDTHEGDTATSGESTPLSHAAHRRAKKRQRISSELKEELSTNSSSNHTRRQNSIWVGNLSYRTSEQALKSFFLEAGEVTRIYLPLEVSTIDDGKKNKGFAYVDFVTLEAKELAIKMSEKNMDGRRLLIKDGSDFKRKDASEDKDGKSKENMDSASQYGRSKRTQKILEHQKQPPGPTIFLGNLGFETSKDSIEEFVTSLRQHGRESLNVDDLEKSEKGKDFGIRKIRVGEFEDTGKCKGFAFIDFESTEHATATLVELWGRTMNKRKLVVEYASADAVRRGGTLRHSNELTRVKNGGVKKHSERTRKSVETRANTDTEFTQPREKEGIFESQRTHLVFD